MLHTEVYNHCDLAPSAPNQLQSDVYVKLKSCKHEITTDEIQEEKIIESAAI